jgi:hypothetical protein
VDADERRRLTEECRAIIEARVREPGEDDDRDDGDLIPLGKALAAIRLGLAPRVEIEPPTRVPPEWLTMCLDGAAALLDGARERYRAAPWAATEDDIEWGRLLAQHVDELRALLDDYEEGR